MTMTFPLPVDSRTIAQIGTRVRSTTLFYEDWQDNFLDAAKWTYAVGSSGAVSAGVNVNAVVGSINAAKLASTATADTEALNSVKQWVIPYGQTALTTVQERLNLEWTFYEDSGAAGIDNTKFFMGLSYSTSALRTTNNIIGFYLASDVLRAMVDSGSTETTSALTTAPTITVLHKYRISIDRVNGVLYYVDDVQQATITTNIPNTQACYIDFYYQTDASGARTTYIGTTRLWMEDLI